MEIIFGRGAEGLEGRLMPVFIGWFALGNLLPAFGLTGDDGFEAGLGVGANGLGGIGLLTGIFCDLFV